MNWFKEPLTCQKNLRMVLERITPEEITRLDKNQVFVFGSNMSGHHGLGVALTAKKKFGATQGRCHGLDNNSYGIPTKGFRTNAGDYETLPLSKIRKYVENFIWDAGNHTEKTFFVTKIGCGLAGYTEKEIAPLFKAAMEIENIYLPQEFIKELNAKK